jgi:amino acid transporter
MSRTRSRPASRQADTAQPDPSPLARLPRLTRIIMVMIFAVALTFLLMPLVDHTYLTWFFDRETTLLPALISAGAGVVMYIVGWRLLVGYAGETPAMRRGTVLYVLVGTTILLALLVLFVIGVIDGVRAS